MQKHATCLVSDLLRLLGAFRMRQGLILAVASWLLHKREAIAVALLSIAIEISYISSSYTFQLDCGHGQSATAAAKPLEWF